MKVIFICTKSITFNTFLKLQADYFLKKGLEIIVSCSDVEKLNIENEKTYKIDFPNKIIDLFNIFKYIKIYFEIKKLVKNNPNSIFYVHTPVASHFFRLFTFFYNLNIIYFVHGFRFTLQTNFLKNCFFKTLEYILSFKTKVFITINNSDFIYAKRISKGESFCYKINGVGLDLDDNELKKNFTNKTKIKKILVISAYKKDKGYNELLKVADLLKKQNIQIECFGYGDYSKFNSKKIKNNLTNINFNNFDKNLKNKIRNFDILIHLSRREGLPVAVMQSLLNGLPVICYNIRGNNDLITNNFNGVFIESYFEIPEIIINLNSNKILYNKMRVNALKTINEDFSISNINNKIYNIIKQHMIELK